MTKRERIRKKIEAINAKILKLRDEKIELRNQSYLLCDKRQWFIEQEETFGRGKKKHTTLVGSVHWKEGFNDLCTGKTHWIERKQIVRINGMWV